MIIYGLSTCALCQKAQKALEEAGREATFRDIRAEPLEDMELDRLVVEFGDRLVDRTTPDYRALNDWLKASEVEAQIAAKPKVMARPVIEDGDKFYLGWDEKIRKALLDA
tara:strand:+ start:38131 stop:38460 length:330 start_codon:yes stop_codon:yes gene_type:complete